MSVNIMVDINYNISSATGNPDDQTTLSRSFGIIGQLVMYVYDKASGEWKEVNYYQDLSIKLKQNQVSEFYVKIPSVNSAEKAYIKEFAEVMFFSSLELVLKGRVQKVSYKSAYECDITGYGMEAKLLDKEFIKSNDKRVQYTNESAKTIAKEILSTNSDGATPWILEPSTEGIFDEDYGAISMRFEHANRLSSLSRLAEAMDYEWSVTQSEDFVDDIFNLSDLLPSQTRATNIQETFRVSGSDANCSETANEKDITNLVNKVDALGYGDGVNQISTSTYNASPIWSTLASHDTSLRTKLTKTATTIQVYSTSTFPSSGKIKIEDELITYTGKTSNTITGCSRGVSSTTAKEHEVGKGVLQSTELKIINPKDTDFGTGAGTIRIMEEQVTYTSYNQSTNIFSGIVRGANSTTAKEHKVGCYIEKNVALTSAETDSSIDLYGLNDYTLIERTILDVPTLELLASRTLIKKMTPVQRINITPDEPDTTAKETKVGDLIKIIDTESGLDEDFRVVGIEYKAFYGNLSINLECSNRTLNFIEQMTKQKQEAEALGKYMQGSTNIYAINEAENCDSTHPLNMRFFIPNETVSINRVKLSFKLKGYRAYSKGVSGAPNSQINTSFWNSNSLSSLFTFSSPSFVNNVVSGLSANYDMGYLIDEYYGDYWVKSPDSSPDSWSDLSTHFGVMPTDLTNRRSFIYGLNWTNNNGMFKAATYHPGGTHGSTLKFETQGANLTGTYDQTRITYSIYNGSDGGGEGVDWSSTVTLRYSDDVSPRSWTTLNTKTVTIKKNTYLQGSYDTSVDLRNKIIGISISGVNANKRFDLSNALLSAQVFMKTELPAVYEIDEQTLTSPSMVLKVGEDGETLNTIGTYNSDEEEIDITNKILDIGKGKWVQLQFNPDQNMRIESNAYIQLFIESK